MVSCGGLNAWILICVCQYQRIQSTAGSSGYLAHHQHDTALWSTNYILSINREIWICGMFPTRRTCLICGFWPHHWRLPHVMKLTGLFSFVSAFNLPGPLITWDDLLAWFGMCKDVVTRNIDDMCFRVAAEIDSVKVWFVTFDFVIIIKLKERPTFCWAEGRFIRT